MRIVLFVLGALLILQITYEVVDAMIGNSLSFTSIGSILDSNLVKLTAAITALFVAKAAKRP